MNRPRVKKVLRYAVPSLLAVVVLGVWVTHQFPSLTSSPKTSVEILGTVFRAPARTAAESGAYVFSRIKREALVAFIEAAAVPPAAESRLVSFVRGEKFQDVTVPFVYYLYDLYGSSRKADPEDLEDLGYEEPPPAASVEVPGGLSVLVTQSPKVLKHVRTALLLFDALFLREDAGEGDEAVKAILRSVAGEMLAPPQEGLTEENEYKKGVVEILEDDRRLTQFVEFFSDFIRDLSNSWLRSFVLREQRREDRLDWVESCLAGNRYYEIADYARSRADRRMVLHVAVDGLQGKLLEGLAQLSAGNREGPGARYVAELYRRNREGGVGGELLGGDLRLLVEQAPDRPDYLEAFKKYFFSPEAEAVTVNVATVDTPAISVRNLPIVFSGHGVAGPYGTGIPNFSYLDRRTGRGLYFWGSDVLYVKDIFGNREELIPKGVRRPEGPGARTLFERLWRYNTVSCMAMIDTGAHEKISSEVGLAVGELQRNFIEKVILLQFRRRARMERELNVRRAWLMKRRGLSRSFLGSLFLDAMELTTFHEHARFLAEHEDEGMPDYALWYNPWPDHYAHGKGPYSDAIIGFRGEYDRLDFYLGKMLEVYASVQTADGASTCLDRTLVGVVSDHGLITSPRQVSTDRLIFEGMKADGIDVRYLKLTHDEGGLPAVHGRDDAQPTRPYDAVVGSTAGGSYIIDLFDPESIEGDAAAWARHPGYHELRDHRLLSGKAIDWIAQLKMRLKDTMDLALVREYGPGKGKAWPEEVEAVVRIITPAADEARIVRLRREGAIRYRYELLGKSDPLDLRGAVRDYLIPEGGPSVEEARETLAGWIRNSELRSDGDWRTLLSYTLRSDVIRQFSHLYDSERAGTINVFPRRFVGFNTSVPGRHAGEAFGEKNGIQLYRGAGLRRAWIQTARNGSLPVTLYHWLAGDEAYRTPEREGATAPSEQFGYPSLLGEEAFAPARD